MSTYDFDKFYDHHKIDEIRDIDRKLIRLLSRRMSAMKALSNISSVDFYSPEKNEEIIRWLQTLENCSPELVNDIWKTIFKYSNRNTSKDEDISFVAPKRKNQPI